LAIRGLTESDALFINIISGGLSIAAVTITVVFVDRIGRKPLLLIGSAGMSLTLGCMAVAFLNAETGADGTLFLPNPFGTLALVAANLYVMFFNLSWGPVMWIMLGEMFPNQIRGTGLAVSGLAQWGSNFAITMTFPILLVGIGLAGAYGFYTVCAVASFFFVYKMVRETRGIELEDMQA
jgi:SP family sugar:H+ symporter-like MFS transporter